MSEMTVDEDDSDDEITVAGVAGAVHAYAKK